MRRRHLIEWLADCEYAPETRRQVIISLRLFFAWLVDAQRLALNPAADLPAGITAHTLRHRFASVAYRSRHDLRAVQALRGHATVATTEVYTAVDPEAVIDSAAAAWTISA